MVLDFKTYQDKVLGCWMGKNIGGVLGAPFEGIRQFNDDVGFYAQDLTMGPPPWSTMAAASTRPFWATTG